MKLECGDIVKNGWAGDNNPGRVFIFVKTEGRYVKVLNMESDGKLHWGRYYATDIRDNPEGKFTVVGHIKLKEMKRLIMDTLKSFLAKEDKTT